MTPQTPTTPQSDDELMSLFGQPEEQTDSFGLSEIGEGLAGGALGLAQGIGVVADKAIEYSPAGMIGRSLGMDPSIPDEYLQRDFLPDWAKPETTGGKVVEGLTSFALAFVPIAGQAGRVGTAVRASSLAMRAGEASSLAGFGIRAATNPWVTKSVVGGSVADFLSQRGDQERLSDLAVSAGGVWDNALTRSLASDPDDSEIEGRLKNAIEGIFLGVAFDGVIDLAKAGLRAPRQGFTQALTDGNVITEGEREIAKAVNVLYQDPIKAAERGLLPPDLASRMAGTKWESAEFRGPERERVFQEILAAGRTSDEAAVTLAANDRVFKLVAESGGMNVDDVYAGISVKSATPDQIAPEGAIRSERGQTVFGPDETQSTESLNTILDRAIDEQETADILADAARVQAGNTAFLEPLRRMAEIRPDGWQAQRLKDIEKVVAGSPPAPSPAPAPVAQNARGQVVFTPDDGKAIISLFQTADRTTLLHEMSHVWRRKLSMISPSLEASASKWAMSTVGENAVKNGVWSRKAEEAFATAWEAYALKGVAPDPALKRVFKSLKEWFSGVYAGIRGTAASANLTPEIKDVFDTLFGKGWNRYNPSVGVPPARPSGRGIASARSARDTARQSIEALGPDATEEQVYQAAFEAITSKIRIAYNDSGSPAYDSVQALQRDMEENGRVFIDAPRPVTSDTPSYDTMRRVVELVIGHAADGVRLDKSGPAKRRLADILPARFRKGLADRLLDADDPVQSVKRIQAEVDAAIARGIAAPEAVESALRGQINLNRLNVSADAAKLFEILGPLVRESYNKARPVMSREATLEAASRMVREEGLDLPILRTISNMDLFDKLAPSMVASRIIRNTVAESLVEAAQRVSATAIEDLEDEVALDFIRLHEKFITTDITLRKVQTSVAQALASGNIEATSLAGVVEEAQAAVNPAVAKVSPLKSGGGPVAPVPAKVSGSKPAAASTTPPAASEALPATTAAPSPETPRTGSTATSGASASPTPSSTSTPSVVRPTPKPDRAKIKRMAEEVIAADKGGGLVPQIRKAYDSDVPSYFEAFIEYSKASLLSGIPTLAVNISSGAINSIFQPFARLAGAAVSLDAAEVKNSFRLMTTFVGAMQDMVKYSYTSGVDPVTGAGPRGLRSIVETVRTESPVFSNATGIEFKRAIRAETFGAAPDSRIGRAVNTLGGIVRLPFRVNQGAEEFWSQVNYLSYVRMEALAAADTQIWANASIPAVDRPAAAAKFVEDFIRESYDSIGGAVTSPLTGTFKHLDAVRFSQSVNFSQDLFYGLGNTLMEAKNKHPWLDLILPFVKAPTNLLRSAARMLPGVGQVQYALQRKYAPMTRDEILRARGEQLLGSAIAGTAAYLAVSGQLTGGGPSNLEERRRLQETGWKPYSFVYHNADGTRDYIEYRRFDPFSSVLGIVSDYVEIGGYLSDVERTDIGTKIASAISNNISNKTYLAGLNETLRAIMQPDQFGKRAVQSRLANLIPNFFGRLTTSNDEEIKELRGYLDGLKRRIPGMSADLPPRRDILGEVITPSPGFIPFVDTTDPGLGNKISRIASPMAFSRRGTDRVREEIAAMAFGFSPPDRKMNGVDLTLVRANGREAYDRFLELTGTVTLQGRDIHAALDALIGSERYQRLPRPQTAGERDNMRVQLLNRVIRRYREAAKRQLLKEFPEVEDAIRVGREAQRRGDSRVLAIREIIAQ